VSIDKTANDEGTNRFQQKPTTGSHEERIINPWISCGFTKIRCEARHLIGPVMVFAVVDVAWQRATEYRRTGLKSH